MVNSAYKTVVVTGGSGFIGATLVRKLVEDGCTVRVLDNLSKGDRSYLEDVDHEFHQADIRDPEQIRPVLANADAVIHLAAYGSVVDSVRDPEINFSINAQGTFNVLNEAARQGVKKLVFASTGGALMGNTLPPVNEDSLPKPISPYGASKLVGEGYCHAYAYSFEIDTVCCRFANIYGPWSGHKAGVVTRYINWLRKGEPLTVFGDGSSTRDYLHVEDLCRGILLALYKNTGKANVFHLASGVETSIKELAELAADVSGQMNPNITFLPGRVGEVDRNFADYTKAEKELGFRPEVKLSDGLRSTWEWFLQNVRI